MLGLHFRRYFYTVFIGDVDMTQITICKSYEMGHSIGRYHILETQAAIVHRHTLFLRFPQQPCVYVA